MATAKLGEYPVFRAYDTTTKLPLDEGKLYTYENGTITDKPVYTDEAKTTEDTNPVILNSNGEATFYMDGEYTFKLDTSADVNLWTVDGINKQDTTTAATTAAGAGNLVVNGSFETDDDSNNLPDGWTFTTWGAVAFDTTDPYHGDQALKFTSTGTGGGQIISTSFIDVSVANNYILRFSIKSSVADVRNVVEVLWYNKDQALVSTTSAYDDSATNPTSWTEKIFTITPGAAVVFAKVRVTGCHNSDNTAGNVKYDHVSLVEHKTLDLETSTAQTVAGAVTFSTSLDVGSTKSATPGTAGAYLSISSNTFTDSNTAGSGTATSMVFHGIAQPTLAATNTSVTTTDAATLYIADAPAAGTNQTITNPWALWIDAGATRLDGAVTLNSTLDVVGNVAVNTNKFNIAGASGNTTIAGTLGVAGDTALTGDLAVNGGDITASGALTITPNAGDDVNIVVAGGGSFLINSSKFTVGGDSGNTNVAGTLGVAGDTALTGDLAVNGGDITASGALTITPQGGSDLTIGLSSGGDFVVNSNQLYVDTSTGNIGMGRVPTVNMTGLVLEAGALIIKEITTPTADADYGKVYTKADNKIYFQDGGGVEHEIAFV